MLDGAGEITHVLYTGYLNIKAFTYEQTQRKQRDHDRLLQFVRDHRPHVVVIGAANLQCRFLSQDVLDVCYIYFIQSFCWTWAIDFVVISCRHSKECHLWVLDMMLVKKVHDLVPSKHVIDNELFSMSFDRWLYFQLHVYYPTCCDNQEEASPHRNFIGFSIVLTAFLSRHIQDWSGWLNLRNVTLKFLVNCMPSIGRVMMHNYTHFLVATIFFMFVTFTVVIKIYVSCFMTFWMKLLDTYCGGKMFCGFSGGLQGQWAASLWFGRGFGHDQGGVRRGINSCPVWKFKNFSSAASWATRCSLFPIMCEIVDSKPVAAALH